MDARYRNIPIETLEFESLCWVHAYWQERKGDTIGPAWPDIDLSAFPTRMVPRVCVMNVTAQPLDFTYRFWGTAITGIHHYDLTGQSVKNLTPPAYATCIFNQYKDVYSARAPRAFLTEVPLDNGLLTHYAVIRLPLSNTSQNVDGILSVEEYGDQAGDLHEQFEQLWLRTHDTARNPE